MSHLYTNPQTSLNRMDKTVNDLVCDCNMYSILIALAMSCFRSARRQDFINMKALSPFEGMPYSKVE